MKFKDKTISVNRVDFSDSLSKLHKYGYDVLSQDWELVAQGEKETPLQKYQRLQCELKELMDEVSQIKVIFVRQFSSYNLIFLKKSNFVIVLLLLQKSVKILRFIIVPTLKIIIKLSIFGK